jgi:hypothetical protein
MARNARRMKVSIGPAGLVCRAFAWGRAGLLMPAIAEGQAAPRLFRFGKQSLHGEIAGSDGKARIAC